MTLLDYIADMDRRAALALAVDANPDYLWQIATGRRKASFKLALRIEVETAGAVTRHTLREDIFGPAPAGKAA